MLTVETIGRIRREHFLKGKTIKEIARDLKVSRNTVRKVLRSGETSFEYERGVQPRPKLGRWTLELDACKRRRNNPSMKRPVSRSRRSKNPAAASLSALSRQRAGDEGRGRLFKGAACGSY